MGGKPRAIPKTERTSELLASILESGDTEKCMAFFQGMPEAERRSFAAASSAFNAKVHKDAWVNVDERTFTWNPLLNVAELAFFCTASYSSLAKKARHTLPSGDVAFAVLADRRPPWLAKWASHLLADSRYWFSWRLIRRMVLELDMQRPEHPNYYLGMISGINQYDYARARRSTVLERLREDPALLEHEVWKLFEHEGSGENSLANSDRFGQDGWSRALLTLMQEGALDRKRLQESCLEALRRDYNHYRAKWFSSVYDLLEPSPDELRSHAPIFLELLGVSAPNIMSWSFKKVGLCHKLSPYDSVALCAALEPTLLARGKGLVKSALKLLSALAKKHPDQRAAIALRAGTALAHEAADVQDRAMTLIESLGSSDDEALCEVLLSHEDLVAATIRGRLVTFCGAAKDAVEAEVEPLGELEIQDIPANLASLYNLDVAEADVCLPAASFDGSELPRLLAHSPIEPIGDIEELVQVCAQVLEQAAATEDVERALDGLSRLCDLLEPGDPRVGPLEKRARQRLGKGMVPFAGLGPAQDMVGLILCWVSGEAAGVSFGKNEHGHERVFVNLAGDEHEYWAGDEEKLLDLLSRRSLALSNRLAAKSAGPLLSAPTHSGGFLDPLALVHRVNTWQGDAPDETEVVLALMRLAPDNRIVAANALRSGSEEWQQAIAYALGQDAPIGESRALWLCAARARAPYADHAALEEHFDKLGSDGANAACYDYSFGKSEHGHPEIHFDKLNRHGRSEPNCVPAVLIGQNEGDNRYMWELGGIGGTDEHSVHWVQSIWPLARESLFAACAVQLGDNLDWWGAEWQNKHFLDPLLDPGTPLREMGLLLLAFGLGAKEPGEHLLATDVAIAAIEDGRLSHDNLGLVCARLLPSGFIKAGRWAKTLAEVARASSAHALVVKLGLEATLCDSPSSRGRDFAKLLELQHELSVELQMGVIPAEAREHLASYQGASKAAKAAKALLQMSEEAGGNAHRARRELLSMRAQAARRWI